VSSAALAADETGDGRLTWAAETALDGFEVVVQQSTDGGADAGSDGSTEPDATSSDGPGFGVVVAVVALLAGAGLAVRRAYTGGRK